MRKRGILDIGPRTENNETKRADMFVDRRGDRKINCCVTERSMLALKFIIVAKGGTSRGEKLAVSEQNVGKERKDVPEVP